MKVKSIGEIPKDGTPFTLLVKEKKGKCCGCKGSGKRKIIVIPTPDWRQDGYEVDCPRCSGKGEFFRPEKRHIASWKGAQVNSNHPNFGGSGKRARMHPIFALQNKRGEFKRSLFMDEIGAFNKDWSVEL